MFDTRLKFGDDQYEVKAADDIEAAQKSTGDGYEEEHGVTAEDTGSGDFWTSSAELVGSRNCEDYNSLCSDSDSDSDGGIEDGIDRGNGDEARALTRHSISGAATFFERSRGYRRWRRRRLQDHVQVRRQALPGPSFDPSSR